MRMFRRVDNLRNSTKSNRRRYSFWTREDFRMRRKDRILHDDVRHKWRRNLGGRRHYHHRWRGIQEEKVRRQGRHLRRLRGT
ncbi:hypothetical protein BRARA_A01890 [Brassica rapa]|uniref:Uncharacterized protein n=1 Tax=Brassica campestris TaxID=3711 RepID=A0A398AN43_BRACM|nr:hypothetical protein BRARA_A01890 [Brassica rapa]